MGIVAVISTAASAATGARAADPPPAAPAPADATRDATALFTKGTQLYEQKRYDAALASLQSSYQLVPSPNSALIIARCLREMGKPAEAAAKFADVEREAKARVAAGEQRYADTAKAAAEEGAAVRATLGTVHVHVAHLPPGGAVQVDGAPVTLAGESYEAPHTPGAVTVTVHAPPAPDKVQTAQVTAGQLASVEIDATPAPPPPPPRPKWMVPALAAAGGVGVVGIAVAIGFGVSSRSTFDSLQSSCGSRCVTSSEKDQIASGQRSQTIANVSLAVGLVGAAAAGTIGVILWRRSSNDAPAPATVGIGPGYATIEGRF